MFGKSSMFRKETFNTVRREKKGMRFEYSGKKYLLEFERDHKEVTVRKGGKENKVKSKYPYTTVTLLEEIGTSAVDNKPMVSQIGYARVGCLPTDKYSHKLGRLYALRLLHTTLKKQGWDKEFCGLMWQTYMNRDKHNKKQSNVVEAESATRTEETVH